MICPGGSKPEQRDRILSVHQQNNWEKWLKFLCTWEERQDRTAKAYWTWTAWFECLAHYVIQLSTDAENIEYLIQDNNLFSMKPMIWNWSNFNWKPFKKLWERRENFKKKPDTNMIIFLRWIEQASLSLVGWETSECFISIREKLYLQEDFGSYLEALVFASMGHRHERGKRISRLQLFEPGQRISLRCV